MAIARPVTKTIISTTAFGIPVVDSVNSLETRPFIAQTTVNANLSNIAGGSVTDLGCAVTFTAKANRVYRIDWMATLVAQTAGMWLLSQFVGGPIPNQMAYVSYAASVQPSYGHAVPGVYFVGPGCPQSFTPGSVTLKLQGNGSGGTWGCQGTTRIAVSEYGGTF